MTAAATSNLNRGDDPVVADVELSLAVVANDDHDRTLAGAALPAATAHPRAEGATLRAGCSERLTHHVEPTQCVEPSPQENGRAMTQPPSTPTPRSTKVVKRYANRKLYDTERSCYVTLDEISQMIKEGEDVRVIDNKTKDDLTAVTLAQIIVEEEKKVQKMPLKLLRSIIQSGNEAFSGSVGKIKDDVERRVEALWRRDRVDSKDGSPESGSSAPVEASDDDATRQGVVQEFVSSTTEAFESWQKRIDERVKEAFVRNPTRPAVDVDALRRRIDELEAKIEALEAARRHGG